PGAGPVPGPSRSVGVQFVRNERESGRSGAGDLDRGSHLEACHGSVSGTAYAVWLCRVRLHPDGDRMVQRGFRPAHYHGQKRMSTTLPGDRREHSSNVPIAVDAAVMVFCWSFAFLLLHPFPTLWYYPLEHRWELATKPTGLAMAWYGR